MPKNRYHVTGPYGLVCAEKRKSDAMAAANAEARKHGSSTVYDSMAHVGSTQEWEFRTSVVDSRGVFVAFTRVRLPERIPAAYTWVGNHYKSQQLEN